MARGNAIVALVANENATPAANEMNYSTSVYKGRVGINHGFNYKCNIGPLDVRINVINSRRDHPLF